MKGHVARDAGFTLLELLVALTVLGFIMLGLSQGLRFGIAAWDRQTRGASAHDEISATERLLRGLIARMEPGSTDEPAALRGLPGAMQFRGTLPFSAEIVRFRRADLALGVDAQQRLVLRMTANPGAMPLGPVPPALEEVLLANVQRLELAYWRRARDSMAGGWQRDWDMREMPELIRIKIVFPTGDSRHWPDIIAAPMREAVGN